MGIWGSRQKCYCAFCRTERMVYKKRRINFFNILAAAVTSGLAMMAIWRDFDPRVLLLFIFFLALAETFVQIRWRLNIVCRECGFDPVLYLRDADKAAAKVKERLEQRKADPTSLLKTPLNLPTRPKTSEADIKSGKKAENSPGAQLLSKNI